MQFVIIHGAFGSAEKNWFPYLAKELTALKQDVLVPSFPVDSWDDINAGGKSGKSKYQTLSNWLAFFKREYLPEIKDKEVCFIGHSLAALFILHLLDDVELNVDSAIFVSPFLRSSEREDLWQFDIVNESFYKTDFDFEKLRKLVPESYVLYSESDPFVPIEAFGEFATLMGSCMIRVKDAGHLNSAEMPLVLELAKSRIGRSSDNFS